MSKGAYCLIICLNRNKSVKIGALGTLFFRKGYYCYVGSAMNNLEKRIERHKSKTKKIHWHIDYFLRYGRITQVVKLISNKKIECLLSRSINRISDGFVQGFGCSDCNCNSHLYFFKKDPSKISVHLKKTFIKTHIIIS